MDDQSRLQGLIKLRTSVEKRLRERQQRNLYTHGKPYYNSQYVADKRTIAELQNRINDFKRKMRGPRPTNDQLRYMYLSMANRKGKLRAF